MSKTKSKCEGADSFKNAKEHAEADEACGRDWVCMCGACRIASRCLCGSCEGLRAKFRRPWNAMKMSKPSVQTRLNAAAPELLKALKYIVEYHNKVASKHEPGFECGCSTCDIAISAIAKAEPK